MLGRLLVDYLGEREALKVGHGTQDCCEPDLRPCRGYGGSYEESPPTVTATAVVPTSRLSQPRSSSTLGRRWVSTMHWGRVQCERRSSGGSKNKR